MKSLPPETVEKYRLVWLARLRGHSFEEIAKAVGYADKSGAKRAFDAACNRYVVESVEQQRLLQSARLDEILQPAMRRIQEGDVGLIRDVLRIEKRRADLWGLDAPKRTEVSGSDEAPVKVALELGNLRSKLAALLEDEGDDEGD